MIEFITTTKIKKKDIKLPTYNNNIYIIKNYKSGFLFWSRLWIH